jgi:hypothetical protein
MAPVPVVILDGWGDPRRPAAWRAEHPIVSRWQYDILIV